MGLWQKFKHAIWPAPTRQNVEVMDRIDGPVEVRRWDVAQTTRLNESQWRGAHGRHVNQDLQDDLQNIWARASYELQNNPILEGVVNTFAIDVVGPRGPSLQIQSDDEAFNAGVEQSWAEFFERPEETQQMHGSELVSAWLRSLCGFGEFFNQDVTVIREDSDIRIGIRQIDVRRLPVSYAYGGWNTAEGTAFSIQYDSSGRAHKYFVHPVDLYGQVQYSGAAEIPADMINHVFRVVEPGQRRGIPWLAACLPVANDLRTFDSYVMTSAKNSAANTIQWWTNHPDLDPISWDKTKTQPILSGSQNHGPPGWQPMCLPSIHPSAQYVDYRMERLRDIGRPICMPVMVVLLSSANSNFASAHYDGQVYMRNICVVQSFLEKRSLNRYLNLVAREWVSQDAVHRRMPKRWKHKFTWPVAPYVNPKQQYDSLRARLEDGTIAYSGVLAHYGLDLEATIAERVRDAQALADADLPDLPVRPNFTGNVQQGQGSEQESNQGEPVHA